MSGRGRVGPVARTLGFAGLLPQAAVVLWMALGHQADWLFATIYALAILSFLGGTWWGFAMRVEARQPLLAAGAVAPSLITVALAVATVGTWGSGWILVVTGVVILLTLLVDRWLVRIGVAPDGWMALRVPLSVGLGMLTIVAGGLAGR